MSDWRDAGSKLEFYTKRRPGRRGEQASPNELGLLFLGANDTWSATVDDPAVVSHTPNVFVIQGAQGLYQARRPGRAMLSAIGDPACRQARPPCALPSQTFSVQVVVQ